VCTYNRRAEPMNRGGLRTGLIIIIIYTLSCRGVSALGVKRAGGRARAKRKICNYCRSTFGAAHAHGRNTRRRRRWLTDYSDWRYSFPIFNNIISSNTCRHRRRRVCAPSLVAPCFTILFFFTIIVIIVHRRCRRSVRAGNPRYAADQCCCCY